MRINKKVLFLLIIGMLFLIGCSKESEVEREVQYKDNDELVHGTIIRDDGSSLMWSLMTDVKTLGDAILVENQKGQDDFLMLEQTDEGGIIKSFEGVENDGNMQWMTFSESCGEDQICPKDMFSIELDEEKEFIFIYEDVTATGDFKSIDDMSEEELLEYIESLEGMEDIEFEEIEEESIDGEETEENLDEAVSNEN